MSLNNPHDRHGFTSEVSLRPATLDDPLQALGLPEPIERRLLKGADHWSVCNKGIRTIRELTAYSEAHVLIHKGMGRLSLQTIIRILASHGWKLTGTASSFWYDPEGLESASSEAAAKELLAGAPSPDCPKQEGVSSTVNSTPPDVPQGGSGAE
jgi:hypothetical protein